MTFPQTIKAKQDYINSVEVQRKMSMILSNPAYGDALDDDQLNPWGKLNTKLETLNTRLRQASVEGISCKNAIGLQLVNMMYEGIFDASNPPSSESKQLMQQFLESSIGNMSLNKSLSHGLVKHYELYRDCLTKSKAIQDVSYFAYKTRNLQGENEIFTRLERLHQAVMGGANPLEEEKLSLKEFAIVTDFAKTLPLLDSMNTCGFISGNTRLEALYKNASQAQSVISFLEQETSRDLVNMQGGILVLDNTVKKAAAATAVLSFFEKAVNTCVTEHGHASNMHVNAKNKPQILHINPTLKEEDFSIYKQLYADMYKINPIALIPAKHHEELNKIYGDEWQKEIVAQFAMIENQMHTNTKTNFDGLIASGTRDQYLAGLSNFIPFGHTKFINNDFKAIHDKAMNGEFAGQNMLCSEFCATTIIASLVELNKSLRNNSTQLTEDVVSIPFDPQEDFHTMHPDSLLATLNKHKCVTPVSTTTSKYITEYNIPLSCRVAAQEIGRNVSLHISAQNVRVEGNRGKGKPPHSAVAEHSF